MELQRIIWQWPTIVDRLRGHDDPVAAALGRSCRPLEAERNAEGVLTVALGCWFRPDFAFLAAPAQRAFTDKAIGRMLEDQARVVLVHWPGGWATGSPDDELIDAPDLFAGLSESQRLTGESCESPVQRHFFAAACRRGLVPDCQFVVGNYRLDFVFQQQRTAVEVVGWHWNRQGAGVPREREERLGVDNWRVRWFSGQQVVDNVETCIDQVAELLRGTQGLFSRRYRPAATSVPRRPSINRSGQFPRHRGPHGSR